MADWELLLLERAKQRDQPCISDLLELYGSCKCASNFIDLHHTY